MKDKVVVVTGATSGVGEAAAAALMRMGAMVVLVGRSQMKCENVAGRLRSQIHAGSVQYLVADLAVMADVARLARDIERRFERLDVLINNAGAIFLRRSETAEGIERTFALNYLAYFILTTRLVSLLKASAPSRVVNVASSGHFIAPGIDFANLQGQRSYRGMKAYNQSKLADVMFTYEMARRLTGTGVTVNAVDPGMVRTNIGKNNGIAWRIAKPLIDRIFRFKYVTPEEGAHSVVYVATSPEVEETTGQYFRAGAAVPSSPPSYDRAAAEQLWSVSESLSGHADLDRRA
jgi:NAD(P)-dependent dehydrogenase (short-subunit alcohol dehydrogenase family)